MGGDAYSAPVVIERSGTIKTPYFLLRDYLGNITHIAKNDGSLKVEYSFDAWGRQRNPSNWTNYDVGSEPDLYMGRGFTGHEHLPWFNLINMNGRLYDPVVGRMLSPDPKVQMPYYTQSFNRYAYCINNPLAYTDPTGYTLIGRFFRWAKKGFDNLGDWASKNHITVNVGYSTNTGAFFNGTPYIGASGNGYNLNLGINTSTGDVGIGSRGSDGFTNFYYPGQNYARADQIGAEAYAQARERGRNNRDEQNNELNNEGLALIGGMLTFEDIYNNFGHNHNTYFLKNGTERTIKNLNGMVRNSSLAKNAFTTSKFVNGVGVFGTALMTVSAANNIYKGTATRWDYGDFTVGSTGLFSGFAELGGYVGFGSSAIPFVGEGVALYSWGRLWLDWGANYGPSTWYGNNESSWFK